MRAVDERRIILSTPSRRRLAIIFATAASSFSIFFFTLTIFSTFLRIARRRELFFFSALTIAEAFQFIFASSRRSLATPRHHLRDRRIITFNFFFSRSSRFLLRDSRHLLLFIDDTVAHQDLPVAEEKRGRNFFFLSRMDTATDAADAADKRRVGPS